MELMSRMVIRMMLRMMIRRMKVKNDFICFYGPCFGLVMYICTMVRVPK